MRDLLNGTPASDLSDEDLISRYADLPADRPWLRLNMVATVDGSAVGADGLSGSINTGADHRVFALLRAWADVILVGAGTVAAEGYGAAQTEPRWSRLRTGRPAHPAMAVVTSRGLPEGLATSDGGEVFATPVGEDGLPDVIAGLHRRGYRHILAEGGPTLAGELLSQRLIDELCLTTSPLAVAGDGGRVLHGDATTVPLHLAGLLEEDGTLLARWRRES
ncbi:dihydrofolate reductase family protein [Branchiibius hedensis]|uniref:dihydrofolate reductase family protein n=1 Tax=Branchiibius hedensis TaxID=672460 RepID=UPI0011B24FF2|nr:dihydrofolate reductase family protein [Branchiibius hedensis]